MYGLIGAVLQSISWNCNIFFWPWIILDPADNRSIVETGNHPGFSLNIFADKKTRQCVTGG